MTQIFVQAAPRLGNQYRDDAFLQSYLQRKLPAPTLSAIAPELDRLGELAGGELYSLQLADRENEPTLVQVLAQELEEGGKVEALAELRVLRRYERWRKSENLIALGLVDGLNRLFSNPDGTLGWIRRTGLGAVDGSALAKRFFMGRAMGTAGELPKVATS